MSTLKNWLTVRRTALAGSIIAVGTGTAVLLSGGMAGASTLAVPLTPGSTVQSASTAPPSTETVGGPGWIGQLSCADLPTVRAAVQRWSTVVGADAGVKGSTAWVLAELTKAEAAGNTTRVERLQKFADRRAAHPDRSSKILARVDKVEAAHCS